MLKFKVHGTVATLKGDDVLNPNRVIYKEVCPVVGSLLIIIGMSFWAFFCWHWISKFYVWAGF